MNQVNQVSKTKNSSGAQPGDDYRVIEVDGKAIDVFFEDTTTHSFARFRRLYEKLADGLKRNVFTLPSDSESETLDEAITEYQNRKPQPKLKRTPIPQAQKAVIETFYWNEHGMNGKVRTSAVKVLKVSNETPSSTGLIVPLEGGGEAVLLSERRVARPGQGCRYHEFRMR